MPPRKKNHADIRLPYLNFKPDIIIDGIETDKPNVTISIESYLAEWFSDYCKEHYISKSQQLWNWCLEKMSLSQRSEFTNFIRNKILELKENDEKRDKTKN